MNRPIKFRAWHKSEKRMFTPEALRSLYMSLEDGWVFDRRIDDGVDVEIMQFTGLHDKNGNEIWEGDICAYRNHDYDFWDAPMQNRGIIAFKNGTFLFVNEADLPQRFSKDGMKTEHCSLEYFEYNRDHIEVLGNIYENPELLK